MSKPADEKFHDHGYFGDGCKVNVLAYSHAEEMVDKISELSHVQEADRLTIAVLVEVVKYISDYATAHHAEQESHILLHSLTVDIPAFCEAALRAKVPDGVPDILHQLDFEMEERIVRAVENWRCDVAHVSPDATCGSCKRAIETMATETEL